MGKRLLRWTWNVVTALSLVLCLAACVLWMRSYWTMDYVQCTPPRSGTWDSEHWRVSSSDGEVSIMHDAHWQTAPPPPQPPPAERGLFAGGGPTLWAYTRFPAPGISVADENVDPSVWHRLGFDHVATHSRWAFGLDSATVVDSSFRAVTIPYWLAAVATAVAPAAWLLRTGRRRARARRTAGGRRGDGGQGRGGGSMMPATT